MEYLEDTKGLIKKSPKKIKNINMASVSKRKNAETNIAHERYNNRLVKESCLTTKSGVVGRPYSPTWLKKRRGFVRIFFSCTWLGTGTTY